MTTFVQTINGLLILNNDATTMKNFYFLLISSLFLTSGLYAGETDYTQGLSIWFDTPNTFRDMLPGMAEDRICGKVKINR